MMMKKWLDTPWTGVWVMLAMGLLNMPFALNGTAVNIFVLAFCFGLAAATIIMIFTMDL